jgi:hypothetical protein
MMNVIKRNMILAVLLSVFSLASACAKVVEYVEDAYLMQASKEMVDIAEKAAELFELNDTYEIIEPKKAGIQINPWNKFLSYGINPQTKNSFIIINPQWFASISAEEQTFLLGRAFLTFQQGFTPVSSKALPYVFILLRILLVFLLIWLLGKTSLANQKIWVRSLIAAGIVMIVNMGFMNQFEIQLKQHLALRHVFEIHELIVEKTSDRKAAIKALEHFDSSVNDEFRKGVTVFAPFLASFKTYANELRKNLK